MQWDGDLNSYMAAVKNNIEVLAKTWTPEERQACLEETENCFRFGGALTSYLKGSPPDAA